MTAETLRDAVRNTYANLEPFKAQVPSEVVSLLTGLWVTLDNFLANEMGLPNGLALPPEPEPPPAPTPGLFVYGEASQFRAGGKWERLADPLADEPWTVCSANIPIIGSHHRNKTGPDAPKPFDTAKWRGKRFLGNSAGTAWGDFGPLWGCRDYDVTGLIDDITFMRMGDFVKGREGHACYVNLMGNLHVRRLRAVQCGGQALQVVSPWERTKETTVPQAQWPTAANMLTLSDLKAIDCGLINDGAAVRASWPIALYGIPCKIEGTGGLVQTLESPEFSHHGETWRSHGALFVGQPAQGKRCPSLRWQGLRIDIIAPDREAIRLWAVDEVELEDFFVRQTWDGEVEESPTLAIVADCKRVVLRDWSLDAPLRIQLHRADAPYSAAYKVEYWDGVGTKVIRP